MCCGIDFTPIAITIALGLHSFFEGIALGVITDFNSFLNLAIGIFIHRIAAAVSLAVTLAEHNEDSIKNLLICLAVFGILQPIGIGIGLALTDYPDLVNSII